MLVATAAPVTPSSGNGPSPKMKHGPRTMFRKLPNHRTRIATAASPDPRKTALIRNNMTIVALPPSMVRVNTRPVRITSSGAPITASSVAARGAARTATAAATISPSTIDCPAARAAPSRSCSPARRATSAVAPIDSPIAAV